MSNIRRWCVCVCVCVCGCVYVYVHEIYVYAAFLCLHLVGYLRCQDAPHIYLLLLPLPRKCKTQTAHLEAVLYAEGRGTQMHECVGTVSALLTVTVTDVPGI